MTFYAHYDRGKVLLLQHMITGVANFDEAFKIASEIAKRHGWSVAQLGTFKFTEHMAFETYELEVQAGRIQP